MTLLHTLEKRHSEYALSIYCTDPVYKKSLTALYILYHEWRHALIHAKDPLIAQIRLTWWQEFFEHETMLKNAPETGCILYQVSKSNSDFKSSLKDLLLSLEDTYIHHSLDSKECTKRLLHSAMALCNVSQEQIHRILYSCQKPYIPFRIRHIFIPYFLQIYTVNFIQRMMNILKMLWFYATGYGFTSST